VLVFVAQVLVFAAVHQMTLLISIIVGHQMSQLFNAQDANVLVAQALVFTAIHQMTLLMPVVVDCQPTTTRQQPSAHAMCRLR